VQVQLAEVLPGEAGRPGKPQQKAAIDDPAAGGIDDGAQRRAPRRG
jgi:hypothetical protein